MTERTTEQKAQASYKKYLQWCKKNKLKANRCESLELYFAEIKGGAICLSK